MRLGPEVFEDLEWALELEEAVSLIGQFGEKLEDRIVGVFRNCKNDVEADRNARQGT